MSRAIPSSRRRRTTSSERGELLRAFDRSGLSAAAFARKHQINYTTFRGWRQHRDESSGPSDSPQFVKVELPAAAASSPGLVVEVGANIRLRIASADQVPLAAALLKEVAGQEAAAATIPFRFYRGKTAP